MAFPSMFDAFVAGDQSGQQIKLSKIEQLRKAAADARAEQEAMAQTQQRLDEDIDSGHKLAESINPTNISQVLGRLTEYGNQWGGMWPKRLTSEYYAPRGAVVTPAQGGAPAPVGAGQPGQPAYRYQDNIGPGLEGPTVADHDGVVGTPTVDVVPGDRDLRTPLEKLRFGSQDSQLKYLENQQKITELSGDDVKADFMRYIGTFGGQPGMEFSAQSMKQLLDSPEDFIAMKHVWMAQRRLDGYSTDFLENEIAGIGAEWDAAGVEKRLTSELDLSRERLTEAYSKSVRYWVGSRFGSILRTADGFQAMYDAGTKPFANRLEKEGLELVDQGMTATDVILQMMEKYGNVAVGGETLDGNPQVPLPIDQGATPYSGTLPSSATGAAEGAEEVIRELFGDAVDLQYDRNSNKYQVTMRDESGQLIRHIVDPADLEQFRGEVAAAGPEQSFLSIMPKRPPSPGAERFLEIIRGGQR